MSAAPPSANCAAASGTGGASSPAAGAASSQGGSCSQPQLRFICYVCVSISLLMATGASVLYVWLALASPAPCFVRYADLARFASLLLGFAFSQRSMCLRMFLPSPFPPIVASPSLGRQAPRSRGIGVPPSGPPHRSRARTSPGMLTMRRVLSRALSQSAAC